MKNSYTQTELNDILAKVSIRDGWNFAVMKTSRQPVPWEYPNIVRQYLNLNDSVLDVGTGGGERFIELATYFKRGVGVDLDDAMVKTARRNAELVGNVDFLLGDATLVNIDQLFDVILNRHCTFDLNAIKEHLHPGGYMITQQVGELNMENIKTVLGQNISTPVITSKEIVDNGLRCVAFCEYNVEYVVKDIESLVFWLNALDMMHADLDSVDAAHNADLLNSILKGNVDSRGFVTNEHRYLVIAQS